MTATTVSVTSDDRAAGSGHPPLLAVDSVSVSFPAGPRSRRQGFFDAVDSVSLQLGQGEILGLVGESGCGKTTLARCIAGLQPATRGRIVVDGVELPRQRSREQHRAVQIVFQDPFSSLNPRLSIRRVLRELLSAHKVVPKNAIETRSRELMALVGLPAAALDGYPSSFSGGQRQRLAIARALAVEPRILVADEPVSALDVSIQASILELFHSLKALTGVSILFVSHNLAAVRHLCDRVAVMYLGRIVEVGARAEVFAAPRHPYTRALLDAAPRLDSKWQPSERLAGEPPSPLDRPNGCPFHPRCPRAEAICATVSPALEQVAGREAHRSACLFRDEGAPVGGGS